MSKQNTIKQTESQLTEYVARELKCKYHANRVPEKDVKGYEVWLSPKGTYDDKIQEHDIYYVAVLKYDDICTVGIGATMEESLEDVKEALRLKKEA